MLNVAPLRPRCPLVSAIYVLDLLALCILAFAFRLCMEYAGVLRLPQHDVLRLSQHVPCDLLLA